VLPKSDSVFCRADHSLVSCLVDSPVEGEVGKIIKQKQKFERLVITKEEGLELFADNPFKVNILTTKVPDGSRTTVYKCGDLIDLCRGPHLSHTGKVKAFAATRHSATNWLGDTNNDTLQRMYGISFPDKKMLKVWKENQEKVRELPASVPLWWRNIVRQAVKTIHESHSRSKQCDRQLSNPLILLSLSQFTLMGRHILIVR
jgi:alanyl-tRNA synthetase